MLVIFDVDGTLIDSQHAIVAAMAQAYATVNLPAPTREAVLGIVGLSVPEAIATLGSGDPDHPVEAIGAAFKQSFMLARKASPDADPLYPGAAETLALLSGIDGVLLGLATGNSRRGVGHFLARFGYEKLFATTQSADDAPSKPHPGMIMNAAAETGVRPEEIVMIGDTTFDMAMARSAGARAIGVSWGYHKPERLQAAGAERVLRSFDELLPVLGFSAEEVRA